MRRMRERESVLIVVALTIMAAACTDEGAGADKAGGPGEPVDLVLADTYGGLEQLPAVAYFVERVGELSDGQIQIEVADEWGEFDPDAEEQVVRDVSSGVADLGWVGTRAFDLMGVESFQALSAPMLVDSYALQDQVIETGLTDQMMDGLDELGVVGLGVLADGLRKPVGIDGPIVGVDDWSGLGFGTFGSAVQADAIRALGATPETVFGHHRTEAIDAGSIQGFEMGLFLYLFTDGLVEAGPYVTANVNLWPQMDVLLANPELMDSLTAEQRGWLEQAADDAASRSAALADTEARAMQNACTRGARFAEASEQDLTALQDAFAPVYDALGRDPTTRSFIEQIQTLKASIETEVSPAIPDGCTGEVPEASSGQAEGGTSSAPAYLNGTYRWVFTQADADEVGDLETGYPHTNTITLKDGDLEGGCFGSQGGTYAVDGDRITFNSFEYDPDVTVTFTQDDQGNLHLTPVLPMDPGTAFECFYKPWTKIE
jgi:TRAP-type C4-dicarboxylate transport system substrate-binding protein